MQVQASAVSHENYAAHMHRCASFPSPDPKFLPSLASLALVSPHGVQEQVSLTDRRTWKHADQKLFQHKALAASDVSLSSDYALTSCDREQDRRHSTRRRLAVLVATWSKAQWSIFLSHSLKVGTAIQQGSLQALDPVAIRVATCGCISSLRGVAALC